MIGFGKTDVGMVRRNNEDAVFFSNESLGGLPNLFIVSDGMGGHNAGEVASNKSIDYFCQYIKDNDNPKNNQYTEENILDLIIEGINYANKLVYDISISSSKMNGMGATFSACVIFKEKIYIAHVGDSRVYRVNKGKITQLTTDHTYVGEMVKAGEISEDQAKRHHMRNIITRALGSEETIKTDGIVTEIFKDDMFVICSDGLSNRVSNFNIIKTVIQKSKTTEEKVIDLIQLAKDNGGEDNISAILIETGVAKA